MRPPKPASPGTTAALLSALFVAAMPGFGAAQVAAGGSASSSGIDGFRELAWGADSARIAEVRGRPDTVRTIEALGARALMYSPDTLGRAVGTLGYLVTPERGLLRVMYLAEYGDGGGCLSLYQHLRDTVAEMFPDLRQRERMYNDAEDLDFCTAFQLGQAGARTIWRDPGSGGRAWVALDLETGVVRVSVESPGYVSARDVGTDRGD